ncbi:MAG TPA: hypothetical protein VKD65_09730, partial [Candidatus Angelobacter sp.]|nr:hypothetical protein [Candidatus Angelobacter sp.]
RSKPTKHTKNKITGNQWLLIFVVPISHQRNGICFGYWLSMISVDLRESVAKSLALGFASGRCI